MASGLGFRVRGIGGVYGFETEPRWSRFCLTRLAGDGLLTLSLVCFCLEQRCSWPALSTANGQGGLQGGCDSKPHFLDYRTPIEA